MKNFVEYMTYGEFEENCEEADIDHLEFIKFVGDIPTNRLLYIFEVMQHQRRKYGNPRK